MCVSFPLLLHSLALTMGGSGVANFSSSHVLSMFGQLSFTKAQVDLISKLPEKWLLVSAIVQGVSVSGHAFMRSDILSHIHSVLNTGITLKDLTPLLFWENGNGNITEVNINDCCLLFLRKSIISFTLALEESCKSLC